MKGYINLVKKVQKQDTVIISKEEYSFLKKKAQIADKFLEQAETNEIELVNRKLDFLDRQARLGKRKTLNSEQALGKYAKYLK